MLKYFLCLLTLWVPQVVAAADFAKIVDEHRKVLVLLTSAPSADPSSETIFAARGHYVLKREWIDKVLHGAEEDFAPVTTLLNTTQNFIDFYANIKTLHDGDRLAFLDLADELMVIEDARDVSAQALLPLSFINTEIEAILNTYREDYSKAMASLGMRGEKKRERWDSYIAFIRTLYTHDELLKVALDGGNPLYRDSMPVLRPLPKPKKIP